MYVITIIKCLLKYVHIKLSSSIIFTLLKKMFHNLEYIYIYVCVSRFSFWRKGFKKKSENTIKPLKSIHIQASSRSLFIKQYQRQHFNIAPTQEDAIAH